MLDILAQSGIELSIGGATVGVILGFAGKHILTNKKKNGSYPPNSYQTKEICVILHAQIKEDLTEIKEILKEIRQKE